MAWVLTRVAVTQLLSQLFKTLGRSHGEPRRVGSDSDHVPASLYELLA